MQRVKDGTSPCPKADFCVPTLFMALGLGIPAFLEPASGP